MNQELALVVIVLGLIVAALAAFWSLRDANNGAESDYPLPTKTGSADLVRFHILGVPSIHYAVPYYTIEVRLLAESYGGAHRLGSTGLELSIDGLRVVGCYVNPDKFKLSGTGSGIVKVKGTISQDRLAQRNGRKNVAVIEVHGYWLCGEKKVYVTDPSRVVDASQLPEVPP